MMTVKRKTSIVEVVLAILTLHVDVKVTMNSHSVSTPWADLWIPIPGNPRVQISWYYFLFLKFFLVIICTWRGSNRRARPRAKMSPVMNNMKPTFMNFTKESFLMRSNDMSTFSAHHLSETCRILQFAMGT